MAALPQELIEEILSRLPLKSLLTFKRVSKKWYSLISHDHKFHLKQSLCSASKNIIIFKIPGKVAIFQSTDVHSHESRKIKYPVKIEMSYSRLIGSANGLICVAKMEAPYSKGDFCCFLWNPFTRERKRISVPVLATGCTLFGFGYDSISDDYKIIADCVSHLQLFSLRSNSWKILEYFFKYPSSGPAFYSKGALHWCASPHITAFDLATETVFNIELPEEINRYAGVPVFGYLGYLCARGPKSVWMMKEYGDTSSWAKLSTPQPGDPVFPRGISKFGEVVFCTQDEILHTQSGRICSDCKSQIFHFGDAFSYGESLISPKYFDP